MRCDASETNMSKNNRLGNEIRMCEAQRERMIVSQKNRLRRVTFRSQIATTDTCRNRFCAACFVDSSPAERQQNLLAKYMMRQLDKNSE